MTPDKPVTITQSHDIATWMLDIINRGCELMGINPSEEVRDTIFIVLVIALSLLLGHLVGMLIAFVVRSILKVSKSKLVKTILSDHVVGRCSHVIAPLVMLALIPWALNPGKALTLIDKLLIVYLLVTIALAVNAVITVAWTRYNDVQNTKNLPLKGVMNTCHGIVWIIIVIVTLSMLMNKSPMMLLTGLGAFAAALMLIFKDPILGLVAGIELAGNDMVRLGDWIEVDSAGANGTVVDITLSTVKVRNFDNTITTLPPYSLLSASFKNWRNMQQMQSRRIMFEITFDFNSIELLSEDKRTELVGKYPILKQFVHSALTDDNDPPYIAEDNLINGSIETNLGLFRAYLTSYLVQNRRFDTTGITMVRTLNTTPQGVPLQVFCFTGQFHWQPYEAVQSFLTEHICAVAGDFGLRVHNAPSDDTFAPLHTQELPAGESGDQSSESS